MACAQARLVPHPLYRRLRFIFDGRHLRRGDFIRLIGFGHAGEFDGPRRQGAGLPFTARKRSPRLGGPVTYRAVHRGGASNLDVGH